MSRRPARVSRQPVHLLPDRIDGATERARAAVGARDLPPHVRLVRWPRRQLLLTARLIADLSGVLDEIADVMPRRAEERDVNFVHGRYSALSPSAESLRGRNGFGEQGSSIGSFGMWLFRERTPSVLRTRRGGGSIAGVATKKPQTISYPAPGSRPRRHDADPLDPHVIVLFGATGDLAKRKLIPGLAYLDQSELAPDIQIIATSLEDLTDDEFRELAKTAIDSFGTHKLTRRTVGRLRKNHQVRSTGHRSRVARRRGRRSRNQPGTGRTATALPVGAAEGGAQRHHDTA